MHRNLLPVLPLIPLLVAAVAAANAAAPDGAPAASDIQILERAGERHAAPPPPADQPPVCQAEPTIDLESGSLRERERRNRIMRQHYLRKTPGGYDPNLYLYTD